MKPKNKRWNHQYVSEASSDSDFPLIDIQSSKKTDSLYSYSVEKCEFCDKVYHNKYNILVHNARHIIIPVFNENLHKCNKCDQHFTSTESLELHHKNIHSPITNRVDYLPNILNSFVHKEPITLLTKEPWLSKANINGTKVHDDITRNSNNIPEILNNFVKKQPVTLITKLSLQKDAVVTEKESILQSFVGKEPITLLQKESFLDGNEEITIISSDEEIEIDEQDTESQMDFEYVDISDNDLNSHRIRDRLVFEDEGEVCDINGVGHSHVDSKVKTLLQAKNNAIILGTKPDRLSDECVLTDEFRSVHYDELTRPGVFRCKKCSKSFPNRYQSIIHETSHLKFKRRIPFTCRYCDWCVGNNPGALRTHIKVQHPDRASHIPQRDMSKCSDCGLRFMNRKRHRQNYHQEFICGYCHEMFESKAEQKKHKLQHKNIHELAEEKGPGVEKVIWLIRTVKMCEFCYQWLRNRGNLQYKYVMDFCKIGERVQCERCEKSFFELRVVRMRMKQGKRDPFRDKDKDHAEFRNSKKPLTNTDRLKNVQKRLKKMKLLNKF